jgi:transposase-like protein
MHVCGKTFNALTGTPLARLQRRDAWLRYARFGDGVSLRKAAKRADRADTAFRWRHRF